MGGDAIECFVPGASGFVGRSVAGELARRGISFVGTCQSESRSAFGDYLRYQFPGDPLPAETPREVDYVLVCARLANPSLCDEPTFARSFEQFARALQERLKPGPRSKIVYVSSDAVFSGKKGQYVETDAPDPVTPYGRRQAIAERAIQSLDAPYLIVRPSYIVDLRAPAEDKRLRRLQSMLDAGDRVVAYTNVYKSPIDVRELARLIVDGALSNRTGILHAVAERKSIYQFFSESLAALGLQDKISLVSSELNPIAGDTSLASQFQGVRP